jgi:hypothetical protein
MMVIERYTDHNNQKPSNNLKVWVDSTTPQA